MPVVSLLEFRGRFLIDRVQLRALLLRAMPFSLYDEVSGRRKGKRMMRNTVAHD
jgi:hypothetical protein